MVALTKDDNGKQVTLKVGEQTLIHLQGNPTTGYGWDVESKPDGVEITTDYVSDAHPPGMVGVGGVYHVTVKATGACSGDVVLGYKRPWEQKASLQSFTLRVTVA